MFKTRVKKTTCIDFVRGYCAATKGIKYCFFAFVENVISKTIHHEAQDEALSQSFNHRSRSDTLMLVLVEVEQNLRLL